MTLTESAGKKISVVVPVRNEQESISRLLQGLLEQTRPPDEIVITDTGSKDETPRIVQEFIDQGAPIKLIREVAAFPGRGRNVGVANSQFEWIAFTDAGTRPAAEWLASLVSKVETDETVDVVYGAYEPLVDTFFKECAAIAYVPPPLKIDGATVRHPSVVSVLMRRLVWENVGGFSEHLRSAEDLLFMRKVELGNFRIVRAPAAIVKWELQPTLWRTFKRFVTYARNNIRAGLWREWQSAMFLRYGLILAAATPVLVLGYRWLLSPLLLWFLSLTVRGARSLRKNQMCFPAGHLRNLARLSLIVIILAAIDASGLIGSINWLLCDKLGSGSQLKDQEGCKTARQP